MPPFPANQRRAGSSCDEPSTNLKVMLGVKASNGKQNQRGGPGRGQGSYDGERAPPGGLAEAGAAAINEREEGESGPPSGSAEAGAAATKGAR